MPRKPIPADESFLDLKFPTKGIDLSQGFGMQQPGTTPSGVNVRAFEPGTQRARGGSRPGLKRYINEQVNGTNLIQDLNVVVGVGYTPPGSTGTPISVPQVSVGAVSAGTTSLSSSFSSAVTSGNAVVVLVTSATSLVSSVTDNQGNSYTQATSASQSGSSPTIYSSIWYALNVNGGSLTVTAHFGVSSGCGVSAAEVFGIASLDQTNHNVGTSSPATSGAVTTTQAGEIAFAAMQNLAVNNIAPPAGWTDVFGGLSSLLAESAYQIFTSVQTGLNPSWTIGGATAFAACIATFRATATATQPSQSGRIVTLVAVSGGEVAITPPGGSNWTPAFNSTGISLAPSGVVRSASNNQKLWFADGAHWLYYDPSVDKVLVWAATAGSLPGSNIPDYPRLICTWRGRTVVSGIKGDPQNWFMSRVGDPTDWDYFPVVNGVPTITPTQAVAGNNSPLGLVGDVIMSLLPYSDDVLVFGGDHTIWVCNGDPMAGGQINLVSDTIGFAWGIPWCKGPDGTLYFFSNKMGIYSMMPGQPPVRMSQQIEQLISNVDTGLNIIRLVWDDLYQGFHTFITPAAGATATTHLFWESRTGAWWTDQFPNNYNPLCSVTLDGNLASDRRTLIGSWDGYVRTMDPTATTDDGTAISSSVLIGPLLTKDMDDVLLKDLQALLGASSGTVTYAVYIGSTAEVALSQAPIATGTWNAGRNLNTFIRFAGHAIWVELSATTPWALEAIRARVAGQGKVRRRYY